MRYLALGDSYTIGEQVAPAERWPVQLAALLQADGVVLGAPQIIARTGWTTGELQEGIHSAQPKGPYDLVSLLIGVNNQYRGQGILRYRVEFAALLDQAVALAGGRAGHVLVLSIPDWGRMPFAKGRDREDISNQIDAFNAVNRQEAERRGVPYVDVTRLSRELAHNPEMVAPDGLHPSGLMYAAWARLAHPVARAVLS